MALNSASTPNSSTNSNNKKRGKSSNQNKQSTAQKENSSQQGPQSQQKKDKNAQSTLVKAAPSPPPPPPPPPSASASASASWQPHVSLPGFNADEIRTLLSAAGSDAATSYKRGEPISAQKQGPWAAKPGTMANGKDFWIELRRQVVYIQRDGGLPKGG